MMANQHEDELMGHNFDGIEEFDNVLPPWWLNLFYFTIVWGVLYFLHFHVLNLGDSQLVEYEHEVRLAGQKMAQAPAPENATLATPLNDETSLTRGKFVFKTNCMVCHGPTAEGGIGPNLTDKEWIHGDTFPEVMKTIREGVPAKGMLSWEKILKPDEILEVASYIFSLKKP